MLDQAPQDEVQPRTEDNAAAPPQPRETPPRWLRTNATQWLVIALGLGVGCGLLFPAQSQHLAVVSNIFLRLIKAAVVLIVFPMLVKGIAGHTKSPADMGRWIVKSLAYFCVITSVAALIGLLAVYLVRPGDGVKLNAGAGPVKATGDSSRILVSKFIEQLAPQSFFESAANNDLLQVVVFGAIFAVALSRIEARRKAVVLGFFDAWLAAMFEYIAIVMKFAPLAVGAAMAATVGHSGLGVLLSLGKLVLTVYGALALFLFGVLWPIAAIARIPVRRFLGAVGEPAMIAFSCSSSEAALPLLLDRLKAFVPEEMLSIVLPIGYIFNLDGTALYLSVASVFIAQAGGVTLSSGQVCMMILTLLLASKGLAGVPRACFVILSATLTTFGLPVEGVALILGVDAIIDCARSATNLCGNALWSVLLAHWEGKS
jgi:proton glutamate symport protein